MRTNAYSSLMFFVILALTQVSPALGGGDPQSGIPLTRVVEIADNAIGFPKGRPESYEVVTAKLFFMKHQKLVDEGIPGGYEAVQSVLTGKQFWLVQYRRWPIRLDGGLAVFIDAHSGEVLSVVRDRH
jgi:hypothetical protein